MKQVAAALNKDSTTRHQGTGFKVKQLWNRYRIRQAERACLSLGLCQPKKELICPYCSIFSVALEAL
jgi:hypothetical protein